MKNVHLQRVKAAHFPPREGLTLWETLLGAISPSLFPFPSSYPHSAVSLEYALPMHFPLRFRPHISILKVLESPAATKMLNAFCWGEGLLFLSPYYVPVMLRALGDGCCYYTHFTVEGTEAQRGSHISKGYWEAEEQGFDPTLSYHDMPAWGATAQLLERT